MTERLLFADDAFLFCWNAKCQEAELLKHLAGRREHEREVAQKALTKERQEHRADASKQQQMHLNASQEEEEVRLTPVTTLTGHGGKSSF